jgi:hypothetical protein
MNAQPAVSSGASNAALLTFALIVYVVYLYLPNVFYRFWLEQFVAIGRRRDAKPIEEFVQAALPSVIFNIVAFALVTLSWAGLSVGVWIVVKALHLRPVGVAFPRGRFAFGFGVRPAGLEDVDRERRLGIDALGAGLRAPALPGSAVLGFRYGWQCRLEYRHRRVLRREGALIIRTRSTEAGVQPQQRRARLRDVVDALIFTFGNVFFFDYIDNLFPYVAAKRHVFEGSQAVLRPFPEL